MSGKNKKSKSTQTDGDDKNLDKNLAIWDAAYTGQGKKVNKLLKAGADMNSTCTEGYTPSLAATVIVDNERLGYMKSLIKAGTDVNQPT